MQYNKKSYDEYTIRLVIYNMILPNLCNDPFEKCPPQTSSNSRAE